MNDKELYNEYVNNGGSASFEGFMSVKESMPIQDFDALLGKKKEDTPTSLGVDSIPQEPQNVGNPLLPTQEFPTQEMAMPISNDLELNPAQQQQVQQAVDTSALVSPLSGENTESLSVQNTPIENSTSALPQNNPIQIKPTSTPITNTMGVKAFVPKPVVSNYKASEIISTSPTDQNGEKQIDFNTIPTQYFEATAEEQKASEDYIKENTFKDYLSDKSGKFSDRKLNQYGYSITNTDKDSIQAENDKLVALENQGLINIDTTQTDKDGRYAWSITNKDYLQTYNDYLKTISDKKDEKQEAIARYNLGGLPTLEASPLQDFARELYTKTGKVIDYADFALLSTESSRNEYLAKSIAESEVKKNPKLNYQEAYDNALKSVQPYSEQELVNGGYNLVNELIKGVDSEVLNFKNKGGNIFDNANFKESDYTDEKSFYQNALKNQDYIKNFAYWWYTQGGKEQFSGNETRRNANFSSQRGRFDIFNAFEAYKQQEDFANYEVNKHLISDTRQKIKQAKENKDYSIINLVDQFDLVADQMNKNSDNAKQRGLLNDARLQSQKMVLREEQEVAKNEADFVNSKLGTLKGHVGNILSGIVDAGKDMALGVARPINMLVGSDAADYYLDEIGKPTQIFNVKMSGMIEKVNTYHLGNKQIEERNGMFFEKVKGELKPITLTTEDKGNLTFVDNRSDFSAKGFFGTVANQVTMMAGAEMAGGKILGLASKGLGRSIEAATQVYGAESKMVKGLQALNKFTSNPRNNGILGWTMATIEDNYQTAKANGLKGGDLVFSSLFQAGITGLSSLVSPDVKFFREAKTLEEGLMVALTQKNSAMVKGLFNNFTNAIVKPALKEVPNEVAQEYVERFAQTAGEVVQSIQSGQNQFSNYSLEEFRDLTFETGLTVATLGLVGKMRGGNTFDYQGSTFDISKLNRKGQLALLANIYDKGVINEFRNKWGISKESADKLEAEVTTLQNYLNKIPNREQYTLEGMFGAALALQDIHNLREQRKTADETFYPKIDADIKEAQDLLTQALEESKIKNEQPTTKPTTSSEPQQEAPQDQTDPTIRENRTVAEKPTVESTTKLNLNGTTAEETFQARNENGDIASESVTTNPNITQNENTQSQESGATTNTTTPNQSVNDTTSETSQLGSDQQTEEEVNLDALQTDINDLINAQQQNQNTKPDGTTESQPSVISENEQRGQENPQAVSETANNTGSKSDVEVKSKYKVHVGNPDLINTDKVDKDGYVYFNNLDDANNFVNEVNKSTGEFLNIEPSSNKKLNDQDYVNQQVETQQNPNEYTRGEKTYTRQENGDFTSINKNGKPQKVTNPKTVAELNDLVDAREKENYDVEESISQNGKYKVKIVKDKTSGKSIRTELVDTKNNTVKKLTDKQTEKYVGEHIYKTEYPETVIDENLTPKEASEEVIKSSNNPKELALLISTLNPYIDIEELNPTDHAIASVIGKNVKRSSYIQFGDRNTIGNSMALSYFAPGNSGMSIDQIAQEAEVMMYGEADKQNPRITTDDVIDFMTNKFPNGKDTFYRQPNPQYLEAVQRFAEITGVNPTQNTTDVILGNKTATKVDTKKLQAEADELSAEQQNNLEKEYNDWFNSLTLEQQYNELNLTKLQDNEHTTTIQEEQKPSTENKSVPKQSTKGSENASNQKGARENESELKTPVKTENHQVYYNGKLVDMGYVPNKKEQFSYAGMRVNDNNAKEGYIKTPKGEIFKVSQSNRSAKKLSGLEFEEANKFFQQPSPQFQKSSENHTPLTKEAFDKLIEQLKKPFAKAFKNLNVTTDWKTFFERAKALGLNINFNAQFAFSSNNKIPIFTKVHLEKEKLQQAKKALENYTNVNFLQSPTYNELQSILEEVGYENVLDKLPYNLIEEDYGVSKKDIEKVLDLYLKKLDNHNIQFMHDSNGEIYGAKLPDGTIYINPEKLNANTAIHEFSHLWEQLMPSGWKKGVELFKQTKVGQDLFNKLKEEGNYSTLSDNELWSEALNTHVGNYGEWRHANPRSKMGQLKQWLTDTFNKLGEYFGFKLSPDTKLKNFTEGVVKDLLGGKPIVAENTTTDSDTKFNIAGEKGVLNSINKEQNSRNLVIAKEMDDKNISAEQITAVTGWYKGNDGKWRVALDFNAKLNPINFNENKEVKLSEILDYPQLFEYYPELKDSRIIISDDKFYFPNENYSAVTNMNNGTIAINKNYFNNDRRSETDKLRAIIHEVQHNIQRIEGFTGGSNQFRAEQIFNNLTTKNRGRFISDREVNQAERTLARHFGSEWLNQFNKGKISKNQIIDVLYENTYGEHEARVAEKLLTSDTKLQDLIDEQKIAEEYKYYVQDSVNYNIAGSNGVVINSDNQDQSVSSLLEARRKDKNNESAEKILLDTGWFKGKDNKWRYVMDQNLTLKNGVKDFSNETKTLQEVVDYPQLFQYYPELADMEVEFTDSKDIFPDNKTKATFDKKQNKIYINGNRATDLRGLRLSIGHEVQHAIQSIEGTSGGTNYASELRNAIEITNEVRNGTFVPSQDGRREQIFSAVYGKDWQSKVENGKLTEHNLAQLLYESNSGEVESTIVEHLLDNNPSQRLDNTLTLLGAVRERGVQYSIQSKNLIPQSTIADVVSAIKEKGNEEGLKVLQNSAWYNRQKDDVKANFNTENLLPRLMDEVKSHSKIQVERAKAKTESVKEKSKQTIAEIKAEHKTKIQEIKEKYAEKIKEVKATANLKQRDRFAKIRNIQKQAYNDLVDLVTSNSIKRSLTPTETERLIKAAAAILNTNQTEKAVQRFMDLYNKINVSELQKQYNNDVKSYAKVKDVVEQGFANGKSLDDIYADNPDIFKFDKAKQNAQRLFERLEAQANPDPNGYQKSLDRAQQLRDAMNKKLEASEVIKNIKRTWIREVSDRQFVPKHLLKNINAKATYQRMITYAGSSGAAKHAFEKINDKIFAFMTNEDNINFNQMVKLKRIIAIDTEREKRDMPYVDHEDGLNKYSAQERLDQMKEKLGEKKFAELLDKSNIYFDAFKSLLKEMHDNGFINDEQYVSMAEVDYQPRQYMQHLFDMEFDEDGKLISVDPITGESFGDYATGLSKDQIKSIQEGSKNLLMDDARLLLANAYLGRTKAKFMNRVNTTFIKKDFPKAQVKYAELTSKDPKTLTKEDKRFIKYFEELDSMVKENPIIGLKNGKPEFLYKDLPSQNWKRAYYFENGIRKEFFMKNELYEQWHDTMKKWLDSDAQNVASLMSGSALTKLMATGRNPGFALVNTPRDFGSVLLLSEEYSNFSPKAIIQLLKDSTLAIGEIWKYNNTQKDNLVSKAMEYGVAMDFLNTEGESPMVAKGLEWVYKKFFNNKGVNNKTKATSQKILDIVTLKSISNYSEMMFRIAVFDRAIQNRLKDFNVKSITDLPKQTQEDIYIDAAEKSRKVLDFNQGGRTIKSLEAVVPYINAATQGTRVLADAMTERPVDTTVRILQGGVMSAALGYGISMLLTSAFKDDDDERSSEEIYLDTKESLSKFQTRGYIHFIDGKKNENGEYTTSKIAVAQPLVPFYALLSNLYDDAIRLKLGREPKGIKYALDEFYEGAAANLDPFGVSDPAKLGTKNPIIKALVTYQSGYDFFKDQALEGTTEKLPRELEGYKSKNIQDFFKLYGEISGMSPSRTKAAVEAMLTSPDTNPFLGMTYASVDAITAYDSQFTEKKGFVKSVVGSFAKRVTAETSEFNRLQNAITAENRKTIEDAAVKEKKLDFIADYYIKEYRKDNNKDVIVKEGIPTIINNQDISPLRKGQLIDKMTSELGKTGATSVKISSIKYDTYGSVKGKAEAILIMFGKDFTKDKEAMTQLAQAGLLTTDVMYEISQLKKSKK